ncbi:MAG: ArsR/SmtB family transcription factor [Hyphomicrobiaceae bacterium]
MGALTTAMMVGLLKAAAEPTRLRILMLLAAGELNVKDFTRILGQSQPRLSRHLRLLAEAGLVERAPEGSWVYFHLARDGEAGRIARLLIDATDTSDPLLVRDRQRAEVVKRERESEAQVYFETHASEWDTIRALHVSEAAVESAMRAALGPGPFDLFVDLGTGTARMLELFADTYRRGLGLDLNPAMLSYARSKLDHAALGKAQVRRGDLYDLPVADGAADAVVMHQVLHFLSDPVRAVREAARILAPGGRLLIVDFAPHELEFLREKHAHERLGLPGPVVQQWLDECGLRIAGTQNLPPARGAAREQLTVSLWLAERPGAHAALKSTAKLEQLA